MNKDIKVIKAYQNNNTLRKSFNTLAINTFGLDFEDWYANGYWKENYIPYSILNKDKIIANISVSPMKFKYKGKIKNYIQLGTVMTDPSYRHQGLIKRLMSEIETDYFEKTDGYFLFANDSVLDFYPKFGFTKAREYQYYKNINTTSEITIKNIPMEKKEDWFPLENAIKCSSIQSDFEMYNNMELIMFYITKFMQNNVYYLEAENAYIIAEVDSDTLILHNIFAKKQIDINKVIPSFGKSIKKVILGFTPLQKDNFSIKNLTIDDTTLFVKGNLVKQMKNDKLQFPTLSHT